MSNNIFANIGGDTAVSLHLNTNMRDLASFFDKNDKIKPEHLPSGNTVELDKIEKRIGTLEGTVAQSAAQVSALKDKVSEIDSLKTEISQIEKNVSERLTLFWNGFNSYNDEKIHELESRVRQTELENSELHHETESLKARLEALEQK